MRKKLAILVATIVALVSVGSATASSQDDGGGQQIHIWIEASITYRSDGFPIFLYCRYGSDGQVTWQLGCWS